ncbi:MAG: bifunctional cytidylyltransferase/SDR family oxidoreductase [Tetrasphaera sp.]|mgnify:CR=1 FL=1|nr:bifunctional cytidylyltransferase/SDR family oxidoreductase [Tetrasphaera sp.]
MPKRLHTVAVILAGGSGSRVGLSIPKQLIKVAGKTVLEHTLDVVEEADGIDEVILLMHPDYLDEARRIAAGYPRLTHVLAGGQTRNETTTIALETLASLGHEDLWVLFHDAVRPLLDHRIIADVLSALEEYDAVDVAIESADTIIALNDDGVITDIPPRSHLRRGQTPQAFRLSTIRAAYERAWADPGFTATDDCTVVLRYLPDVPITVVTGSDKNMKITHPIDVFIADKLFQIGSSAAPPPATAQEYEERLSGKVIVVLGGSYGIGADIAELATGFGATVHRFSRSGTGTHVERIEDVEAALKMAYSASGRIDAIVVTAGVLRRGPLASVPLEDILESIRVNYIAPVAAARCGLEYLEQTGGQLLFFTSSSYTRGRADYSIYSSTKAAVVNLTQALADEWSPLGVRVNCINPERTATPMRAQAFGEEPAGSLLSSTAVALTSIDVLLSNLTGHVIDVRRVEPGNTGMSRTELEAAQIAAALSEAAEEPYGTSAI